VLEVERRCKTGDLRLLTFSSVAPCTARPLGINRQMRVAESDLLAILGGQRFYASPTFTGSPAPANRSGRLPVSRETFVIPGAKTRHAWASLWTRGLDPEGWGVSLRLRVASV
jgi:hypothetical protein